MHEAPADMVLVNPPARGEVRRWEHLGLGYLAAALRRAGIAVKIVDAHLLGASIRQTVEAVVDAAPRVVGITAGQPQGRGMATIAQEVRRRLPEAHIVAGGHFATFCHDRLLRDVPALDSVVRGEADLAFVELARRILADDEWRGLPGVSFRQDGTITDNSMGPLVTNLDGLPFPARDTALLELAWNRRLTISSSRGCYGRCTFCSVPAFYGLQAGAGWRARSPESVLEEMVRLERDYGCKRFMFVDDNFVGPGVKGRDRAHAFADGLLKGRPDIQFAIACRATDVEWDLFRHLHEAGLSQVMIGIESGNQHQLDRYRKGATVEDGRRAISITRELGISVTLSLITFDPDCTLGECLDTLRFLASDRLIAAAVNLDNLADPFDGTELCDQLRRQERLRGSYLGGYTYSWRDPTVALCVRAIRPLARLVLALPNPLATSRRHRW